MGFGLVGRFPGQTQEINSVGFRFGRFGGIGKWLFELASCKPLPDDVGRCSTELLPLIGNLYASYGLGLPAYVPGDDLPRSVGSGNECVVAFTGGRDSVCVASMLLAEGHKVHLLHFQGLNRSHYREAEKCRRISRLLECPLTVRKVRIVGSSGDLSNRFRNQFLLCQQLDFAEEIGAGFVAQGNHRADHLGNVTRWIWFADARENYQAFQAAFRGGIGYKTGLCVNPSMVYRTLFDLRPELLPELGSCVHPHMYMDLRRRQVKERWGVSLFPGRCGVCYKCCWEYLVFGELGLLPLDRAYSMHCLDTIMRKWHYFYDERLRPDNRAKLLDAIVDPKYLDMPTVRQWVEESSNEAVSTTSGRQA